MKNGSGKFRKQPSQFNYQRNFSRQLLIKNVLLEGKQGLTGLTESNWENHRDLEVMLWYIVLKLKFKTENNVLWQTLSIYIHLMRLQRPLKTCDFLGLKG